MVAMVCGLSLAATSCKDDDNDNGNNGRQPTAEEQAAEDANTFWSVAANLVNSSDVPADYKDYTKSTDGKSLAKVDVSIKQIPHLQQIVYKTVEQMGDNAVTDGVPYYSFGDVVRIDHGKSYYEYVMCIQPPFTKEGSTKSVWASVSFLT